MSGKRQQNKNVVLAQTLKLLLLGTVAKQGLGS